MQTRPERGVRVLHRNYTYVWRSSAAIPYTTSVDFTDGVVMGVRCDRKF